MPRENATKNKLSFVKHQTLDDDQKLASTGLERQDI